MSIAKAFSTNDNSKIMNWKGKIKASEKDSFIEQLQLKASQITSKEKDDERLLKIQFFKSKPKSANTQSKLNKIVCKESSDVSLKSLLQSEKGILEFCEKARVYYGHDKIEKEEPKVTEDITMRDVAPSRSYQ